MQAVQAKKQNLAGPMRITVEGSMGAWCVCLFALPTTTPDEGLRYAGPETTSTVALRAQAAAAR